MLRSHSHKYTNIHTRWNTTCAHVKYIKGYRAPPYMSSCVGRELICFASARTCRGGGVCMCVCVCMCALEANRSRRRRWTLIGPGDPFGDAQNNIMLCVSCARASMRAHVWYAQPGRARRDLNSHKCSLTNECACRRNVPDNSRCVCVYVKLSECARTCVWVCLCVHPQGAPSAANPLSRSMRKVFRHFP